MKNYNSKREDLEEEWEEKQMNEMMSKRRIQITDLQKQEIEEKQEIRLLIRLHIFYLILLYLTSGIEKNCLEGKK